VRPDSFPRRVWNRVRGGSPFQRAIVALTKRVLAIAEESTEAGD